MRTPSIKSIKDLGVAQLVARYLGVVEAVGSSPVTQTIKSTTCGDDLYCCAFYFTDQKLMYIKGGLYES